MAGQEKAEIRLEHLLKITSTARGGDEVGKFPAVTYTDKVDKPSVTNEVADR